MFTTSYVAFTRSPNQMWKFVSLQAVDRDDALLRPPNREGPRWVLVAGDLDPRTRDVLAETHGVRYVHFRVRPDVVLTVDGAELDQTTAGNLLAVIDHSSPVQVAANTRASVLEQRG